LSINNSAIRSLALVFLAQSSLPVFAYSRADRLHPVYLPLTLSRDIWRVFASIAMVGKLGTELAVILQSCHQWRTRSRPHTKLSNERTQHNAMVTLVLINDSVNDYDKKKPPFGVVSREKTHPKPRRQYGLMERSHVQSGSDTNLIRY
jgi:hypothetical protein